MANSKILYSIKGPKTLFEMTWAEVAQALKETDIVIIPAGSIENHGLHLPLGSDTIQGIDFGKRMALKLEKEGIKVVVAPTIPFGVSDHHMGFPGTITINSLTLGNLIKEICHSLYCHGFRKFLLLYAHGGTYETMKNVAPELASELPEAQIAVPNWLTLLHDKYPELLTSDRPTEEGHSGEGETSRMLASAPELVEMNKAKVHYREIRPAPVGGTVIRARGRVSSVDHFKEITPYGSIGNPLIATKETGEKIYDCIVDFLCEVVKTEFK